MSDITFHDYSRSLMENIDEIVMSGEAVLLDYRIDPRNYTQIVEILSSHHSSANRPTA